MTEKHIRTIFSSLPAGRSMNRAFAVAAFSFAVATLGAASLGAQAPATRYPTPGGTFNAPQALQLPQLPVPTAITPNGKVVEDVIARVNDQIITRSEYERAEQQLLQEAQQQNMSPADVEDRLHNMLRDMIDQQLLLSKGKELGITGDSETMRRLDDIRKQNHLDSMEALEKAASQQGVSFEDFKQGIRNNIITQQVVRDEVGRRLSPTRTQEQAFYDAHAKEFEVPEQLHLSEILIPTPENATDAQIAAAQTKTDEVSAKLKAGGNFVEIAKSSSGGPTASAGGDLGDFKRGTLGKVLEDATFPLAVGGVTAPIRTRQGFVLLRVDSHQAAGVPPLETVESQVQEAVYMDALQPALRAYLTKARTEAYVDIKPGFIDSGSPTKNSRTVFTAYAPPPVKKKVVVKQQAEQVKAARDQAALAAARQKVADKQAAKAAESSQKAGVKNVSMPVKPKKIRREKIRYGQAPRNSLPAGAALTTEETGTALAGQAPGVAMAPTESVTSISTGTGTDSDDNPLTATVRSEHKTRFSSHQTDAEETTAKAKLVKAEAKATTRPVAATSQETASEKQQAAPLGLNGDTVKKKPKAKRKKGDPKERMQEQVKPVETTTPVAPTVNSTLGKSATAPSSTSTAPSSDQTTLPSAAPVAPGASPIGQPIPAATSAEPGQSATTPVVK